MTQSDVTRLNDRARTFARIWGFEINLWSIILVLSEQFISVHHSDHGPPLPQDEDP